ncbi:MAG TPA: hypothetical protein VNT02_12355, partial [Burkholderiales bacterium]|nr:hypothetical protein [Burkholderiales bacterium]
EQLAERQRASVQRDDAVGALRDDIDALHERIENLQSKGKRTPSEEADLRSSLKRVENLQSKLESAETAAAREAAAVAETQKEIDTVDASLAQYKNARPWRALDMSTAKPEQLGLYGELEGTARMKAEGFEPLGKTVDPENILTPGEFDSAVEAYHGQTGIDGIYKRINPQTGETEYWCGEMKTTGDPNPKEPTGKGALSRTTTGDQLSDTWIRNNLRKSGLSESEQIDFLKALDAGKVKKFYAHTTSSGTKFYSVSGVNEVAIGPEITKF